MKKSLLVILILGPAFILASCGTMYVRPTVSAVLFRQQIPGNAELLFKTVQKLLPMMGYKLQGSDVQAGTVTTDPMEMKVDPSSCDCGTAMGMPVIKSGGTKVKVVFVMGVSNNELTVRAEITPELDNLMSTLATAGMEVACVSKGKLEETLAKNFLENMKTRALQLIFN